MAILACYYFDKQSHVWLTVRQDANDILILYPQAVHDSTPRQAWQGLLPNPNGCWDWVGWYGQNADQKGGERDPEASGPFCLEQPTKIPARRSDGCYCQPSKPDHQRLQARWWRFSLNYNHTPYHFNHFSKLAYDNCHCSQSPALWSMWRFRMDRAN